MNKNRIVTEKNFANELLIAGWENPNSGVCQGLCDAIDRYEPIYLSTVLGYGFYQHVLSVIEADPENVPEEYAALIDGSDYLFDGVLMYWEGLRTHAAQYIYYWYNRGEMSKTTGMGQMVPSVENGNIVSVKRKLTDIYNRAMFGADRCYQFMYTIDWPDEQPQPQAFGTCRSQFLNVFGI